MEEREFKNEAYRYGFNGMENDKDVGIGVQNFGARIYNSEIGRWLSIDPLAEKAPSWTPYRAFFNNPIKFIDPDGMFELDEQTAKENPELVKFLQELLASFNAKSDEYKQSFYETSGLTEEETIEMLTYESGPSLKVKNLDTEEREVNGITVSVRGTRENKYIAIDDDLNQMLKDIDEFDNEAVINTFIESTLIHEGVHYGRNKKGLPQRIDNTKEAGKEFEKKAYGRDLQRKEVKKARMEKITIFIDNIK